MRKNIKVLGVAIVSTAILSLVAAPNAAFATDTPQPNPGTSSLNITGNVPEITYLPTLPSNYGEHNNTTLNGNMVSILQLADNFAHRSAASITIMYAGVTTNYPAKIGFVSSNKSLKSGGNILPYTAEARTLGLTTGNCLFNGTTNTCKSIESAMIENQTIEVEINTTANNSETIVAGTYSDILTLNVGTNF